MSKEKFLKVYANLPAPEREQIISIIDNNTYSWNVAYVEILNNTQLGRRILKKMEVMGLL